MRFWRRESREPTWDEVVGSLVVAQTYAIFTLYDEPVPPPETHVMKVVELMYGLPEKRRNNELV